MLVAFGYPQKHEDDAWRGARMALDLLAAVEPESQASPVTVELRFGIHTGLVVLRERSDVAGPALHDLTGLVPQIASRLVELAGPNEVWVSRDTRRLLRDEVAVEPVGECVVPELSDRLPMFRVRRSEAPSAAPDAAEDDAPLVGRAAQLEQLRAGWAAAGARRGSAVLLTGEPGIGKSRLLRELRRMVPAEAWVECRCAPESESTALRPIIDWLREFVGDTPLDLRGRALEPGSLKRQAGAELAAGHGAKERNGGPAPEAEVGHLRGASLD